MKTRLIRLYACCCMLAGLSLGSCQHDDLLTDQADRPLAVDVKVHALHDTRTLVLESGLAAGQKVGVSLFAANGSPYTGSSPAYVNVPFTSVGTGTGQTWSGAEMLVNAEGKAAAYFPYSSKIQGTTLPVETASVTDYLYSGWVSGIQKSSPAARFTMKHGLAAFRIRFIRGVYDYFHPCKVSSIGILSSHLGTEAMLDFTTGALTDVRGTSTWIESKETFSLPQAQDEHTVYLTAVPVPGAINKVQIRMMLDGVSFTAPIIISGSFQQGSLYCLDLVLTDMMRRSGLQTRVVPWTNESVENNH